MIKSNQIIDLCATTIGEWRMLGLNFIDALQFAVKASSLADVSR
jgi:hypothetical protein